MPEINYIEKYFFQKPSFCNFLVALKNVTTQPWML